MNNDVFVLLGIDNLRKEHINMMAKKYKGTICTDKDGDEFEIHQIFERMNEVYAGCTSVTRGYFMTEQITKLNLRGDL